MANTIESLCQEWIAFKEAEAQANASRLQIEKEIIELSKADLPSEGTARVGNLKVSTGFTRTWSTPRLTEIYRLKPQVFPFKIDWKEDRRQSSKIEATDPSLMAIFADALTIKEKKPAFTRGE